MENVAFGEMAEKNWHGKYEVRGEIGWENIGRVSSKEEEVAQKAHRTRETDGSKERDRERRELIIKV